MKNRDKLIYLRSQALEILLFERDIDPKNEGEIGAYAEVLAARRRRSRLR